MAIGHRSHFNKTPAPLAPSGETDVPLTVAAIRHWHRPPRKKNIFSFFLIKKLKSSAMKLMGT
jgi:hypothetical protein